MYAVIEVCPVQDILYFHLHEMYRRCLLSRLFMIAMMLSTTDFIKGTNPITISMKISINLFEISHNTYTDINNYGKIMW